MTTTGTRAVNSNPYNKYSNQSFYSAWREQKLVCVLDSKRILSPLAETVHTRFREHVSNPDFPCIGAKASFNGGCYRFGFYPEMNGVETTSLLAHDLWLYVQERPTFNSEYATFVASFALPKLADEKSWEDLLWAQLQSLHELDGSHYGWDKTVSSDPENPDFSFSFAETGFFVVGLHPASSRISRRFGWATLVFNAHSQFQRLRQQNQFERMRETIRARDLKLQGSLNPNLSDFGRQSEARQYSGRAVEQNWKCPFHAQLKEKTDV
jgi:FPC/CPF motif-containing protein YcgG